MSLTGKLILAALAAVFTSILILPALAILAVFAILAGCFGLAVALWAVVLLGERWFDEGLDGYTYLDALDDALNDVFHRLRRLFAAKVGPTFRERLVASLPLLAARGRVLVGIALFPVAIPLAIIGEGFRIVRSDLRGVGRSMARTWAGKKL